MVSNKKFDQFGIEVYFADQDIESEWKKTWILDGNGNYEVVFDRSDGKVFTAAFKYFEHLGGNYLEITELRSVQKEIPEWVKLAE